MRQWTSDGDKAMMIDIHTHVLPGVDDGAADLDEALALLAMAADSGVDTVVTTPHCNIPGEYENYACPELDDLWRALGREARRAGIPVHLCRGMEILATEELPELLTEQRVWTLNGTSYFLTEFAFGEDPAFCFDVLQRCARCGFQPLIAHPERYLFLQEDPELAFEWCTAGYALQVNKGSLLGRFGRGPKRMADMLLQHGLCACVASDAHNPRFRSTHMTEVRDYLMMAYGEDYSRLLLELNPARILSGRDLLGYEPIPFR